MKITKIITAAFIAVAMLPSCSEDSQKDNMDYITPIFSTQITRMQNNQWNEGDKIGISMLSEDDEAISLNHPYSVSPSGEVTSLGSALTYPTDNSTVNFRAYYPFLDSAKDGRYAVSLSDQSKPEEIDLLYSNNAKSLKIGDKNVTLEFKHMLSLVHVKINKEPEVKGDISVKLNMNTSAVFDLKTGTFSEYGSVMDVYGQRVFAIPNSAATLSVTCGDNKPHLLEIEANKLVSGKRLLVNVNISKKDDDVDFSITFGNATIYDWDEENIDFNIDIDNDENVEPVKDVIPVHNVVYTDGIQL